MVKNNLTYVDIDLAFIDRSNNYILPIDDEIYGNVQSDIAHLNSRCAFIYGNITYDIKYQRTIDKRNLIYW